MDKYYTVKEVMELLNMCDETIYRYIRSGKLKATRLGKQWRINENNLNELMQGGSSSHESH